MTSNLGSKQLMDLSQSEHERHEAVMAIVRQAFKPEFLNRLDDIVMFDALTSSDLGGIVKIQLGNLGKRLSDRRLELDVSDDAVSWLVSHGFDPVYGARPLRRLIQTAIGDPLAKRLLGGEIHDGQTVHVDKTSADELVLY